MQRAAQPTSDGGRGSGGERPRLRALIRSPALHFLAIGAALAAVVGALRPAPAGPDARPEPLVVSAERVARLRRGYARRLGREPTDAELRALIEDRVAEELLYREALALGLDRGDAAVRRRVVQKMRFLAEDEGRSPEELYHEGKALGLDREDIVIRRLLAEKMRLLAALPARRAPIGEAELRAYLSRHRSLYRTPPRLSLTHVFLSRDRRGRRLERDARALLERLRARGVRPEQAASYGDPFPLDRRPRARTRQQLGRMLGWDFADRVMGLPTGRWEGPVPSAFGLHLVWVEERLPARDPPLEEVRRQIEERIRAERGEARVADLLDELRRRYRVRIEMPPTVARRPAEAPPG